MRSRKPLPGSTVTLTLISSEMTRVPAVTAERSPPASRITGALSPVIAASFTDATPETTSPSEGMRSPVWTSTMSPTFSWLAGTVSYLRPSPLSRLAVSSAFVARKLAACALPLPSASASAKVPNSTVSHSQATSCSLKPIERSSCPIRSRTVISVATVAVTNMTGFRTSRPGASLVKEAPSAGTRRSAVKRLFVWVFAMSAPIRTVGHGSSRDDRRQDQARGSAGR